MCVWCVSCHQRAAIINHAASEGTAMTTVELFVHVGVRECMCVYVRVYTLATLGQSCYIQRLFSGATSSKLYPKGGMIQSRVQVYIRYITEFCLYAVRLNCQ